MALLVEKRNWASPKGLIAGIGLLSLAGCGVAEVDAIRTLEPQGGNFNKALAREYRELVLFEADEMFDWISAARYAEKGLAADAGQTVDPFMLADFNLPADMIDEMTTARADLMSVFAAGAKNIVPAAAADAQGKFDCWVEQQEENHQPGDIKACRDAFYAALGIIKAELEPKPATAPAPQATAPKSFTVLFDFDKFDLSTEAQNVVISAISAAKEWAQRVFIVGHTDTAGDATYNMSLSQKRAATVEKAFTDSGVPATTLEASGVGEKDLAVPTADGVADKANRRVTISIGH